MNKDDPNKLSGATVGSNLITGAASGASTGAALGSLVGPAGTAIGAGAGALIGLGAGAFDSVQQQKQLEAAAQQQQLLTEQLNDPVVFDMFAQQQAATQGQQNQEAMRQATEQANRLGLMPGEVSEMTNQARVANNNAVAMALPSALLTAQQAEQQREEGVRQNFLTAQSLAAQQARGTDYAQIADSVSAAAQLATMSKDAFQSPLGKLSSDAKLNVDYLKNLPTEEYVPAPVTPAEFSQVPSPAASLALKGAPAPAPAAPAPAAPKTAQTPAPEPPPAATGAAPRPAIAEQASPQQAAPEAQQRAASGQETAPSQPPAPAPAQVPASTAPVPASTAPVPASTAPVPASTAPVPPEDKPTVAPRTPNEARRIEALFGAFTMPPLPANVEASLAKTEMEANPGMRDSTFSPGSREYSAYNIGTDGISELASMNFNVRPSLDNAVKQGMVGLNSEADVRDYLYAYMKRNPGVRYTESEIENAVAYWRSIQASGVAEAN